MESVLRAGSALVCGLCMVPCLVMMIRGAMRSRGHESADAQAAPSRDGQGSLPPGTETAPMGRSQ